jgi:hypothetical protein
MSQECSQQQSKDPGPGGKCEFKKQQAHQFTYRATELNLENVNLVSSSCHLNITHVRYGITVRNYAAGTCGLGRTHTMNCTPDCVIGPYKGTKVSRAGGIAKCSNLQRIMKSPAFTTTDPATGGTG